MSRRHQDEVCTARKHQIQIKAQLHKDHLEEEKLYTRLWREDELVKLHREETEAMQHHQANQQNVAILNKQVSFKLEKEREAEREKELEFQELEEERKQRRAVHFSLQTLHYSNLRRTKRNTSTCCTRERLSKTNFFIIEICDKSAMREKRKKKSSLTRKL
jgi:hypothetical protein